MLWNGNDLRAVVSGESNGPGDLGAFIVSC